MIAKLVKHFSNAEVDEALNQMTPLKAPRPDEYNAEFYQFYWHIVGNKVSLATLKFVNEGIFEKSINYNYIVLIPKIKNPLRASDFKPISLCNVVYKLISKVFVNRFKKILFAIVSNSQSAFILDRLITDNVIRTYEAFHSMKARQKSHQGSIAIKLDIIKTYDGIKWVYLENIMRRIGFDELWIAKIMMCASTVTYSVMSNG